jgi:hypothetical protein
METSPGLDQTFQKVISKFGDKGLESRGLHFGGSSEKLYLYSTDPDPSYLFLYLTKTENGYCRILSDGTKRKVKNPERVIREFLLEGYSKLQRVFNQDFELDPNAGVNEKREEIRAKFDTLTNILGAMGYLTSSRTTSSSGLPRVISLRGPYKRRIERDFIDASRLAGFCCKHYSPGHSYISMDYKTSVRERMKSAA